MKFSSFVFPLRCPVCDGVTDPIYPSICPGCREKIPVSKEPRCVVCGKRVVSDVDIYCADSLKTKHFFTQGRAAWSYSGAAAESVQRFKFSNRRQYAPFYAQEMMRCMGSWLLSRKADALIPIPVSTRRLLSRGYNQASLLAYPLSYYLDVPVREDILMRRGGIRQQKELSGRMRHINLLNAFYTQAAENMPKTVILIDDIYTTGSTIDAASAVLLKAGVKTIYAAYLCVREF